MKPARPCSNPQCPNLAPCAAHPLRPRETRWHVTASVYQQRRGVDSAEWQRLRRAVFRRDPACVACGSAEDPHVDHVVPVSRGGVTTLANLQRLCAPCHAAKTRAMRWR